MNIYGRVEVSAHPGAVWCLLAWLAWPCVAAAGAEPLRVVPVGLVPAVVRAADLDGDHKAELVVGGLDQDAIHAVSLDGTRLWRRDTQGIPAAIEVGDLNGDGRPEIAAIIGTSASKIIILDAKGALVRQIQPDAIVYFLRLADVNGDKKLDIVVSGYMGKVLAYDFRGAKLLDKTVVTKNFYRQMAGMAVGDVDGDGQADIAYHGSLQSPGIIDAAGKPIRRSALSLSLRGDGLAACADVNGDGKAELILASLAGVRVEGLDRTLWSVDLHQKGGELGLEADGVTKLPYEYGGTRSVAAGNFTKDDGPEIASFASDGKFDLLSARGKRLLRTKTRYPFVSIAAGDVDGDGLDEALLGRLHYQNVYVVKFAPDPKAAEAAIARAMSTDAVTDGIDRILAQIDALKPRPARARSRDEKLHVLWGMEATIAPALMASTIRAIDQTMRELRCENVEYAFMFTLKERGVDKFKRDGICAVSPLAPTGEKLLDQCRQWERMGVRFYPVISHMGVPTVMPDTARKIMDVAPNACQGYLTWETMANYPSEVWYDFLTRMADLAEICLRRDKKILFAEEAPFWVALVMDPKARAILLKPQYRKVLVPVLKTLAPYCDETDVSAYVGSMLAGEIDTWGITSEEDFWPYPLGHYRGCPDDIVMRQEILAVALGARYLMIESGHVYFEPLDAGGHVNPFLAVKTRIARESRRERMTLELFRKGVVGPVRAGDLLSVSPVGLRFSKSPRIDRATFMWKSFGTRLFDGNGLVNYDISCVLFNSGPYSLSRNLYGCRKLMTGLFPTNQSGLVPIFGPEVSVQKIAQVTAAYDTDGEFVTIGGERLPAEQAMPKLAHAVQAAAARLPFRADGVFLSARRDGTGRYQVFLMDTEMFAPAEVRTTLTTTISGLACADEITSQSLPVTDNRVPVTVPAGGWRLLRFEAER